MMRMPLLAVPVLVSLAVTAQAAPSSITVTDAWARATPPGARIGAAYVTIVNHGTSADRLVGASAPVAKTAQVHATITDNGVMKMRTVAALEVKPGASVALKPDGLHVMLMGLKQPLSEGQSFPLTLTFAKAGRIETMVKVAKVGAMSGMDMGAMPMGR